MILCSLHGSFLSVLQHELLTTGCRNTTQIKFVLDDAWAIPGASVFCQFKKGEISVAVPLENGMTAIPPELLRDAGLLTFAIIAKDADERVIRTSRAVTYQVYPGADPGADVWIDWDAFKADLIAALNDRFSLELANDADNDTILAAIAELENGYEVRTWWIGFINRELNLSLSPDDSDVDVELNVGLAIDRLLSGSREYGTLAGLVAGLVDTHIGALEYIVEPVYLDQIPALDGYMTQLEDDQQIVVSALSSLYIGG